MNKHLEDSSNPLMRKSSKRCREIGCNVSAVWGMKVCAAHSKALIYELVLEQMKWQNG